MKSWALTHNKTYKQGVYWTVFILGLIIMSYGIVLMITAHLGSAPWDVFHIGLFKKIGLTIGTWSIIVGFIIIVLTSILTKKWPPIGAFANMVLVGVFIDLFLALPWMAMPHHLIGKTVMLLSGIILNGIGISIYISAKRGAGPRDTLMIYLTNKMGWKLANVRRMMELSVLVLGWFMGGPVSFGTILFGLTIGSLVGKCLPICENIVNNIVDRGAGFENFHERAIRTHHHDGSR